MSFKKFQIISPQDVGNPEADHIYLGRDNVGLWEKYTDGEWVYIVTGGTTGAGTSGTSGLAGSSGKDGSFLGSSGTSGGSGTPGSSGKSGSSGKTGTDGTAGTSGTSGVHGTAGTSGTSGSSGITGSSGTSGNGSSGTSGLTGSSGSSGLDGAYGGATRTWTFTSTPNPTGGKFYSSVTNLNIISDLIINNEDYDGQDLGLWLPTWTGGILKIEEWRNLEVFGIYEGVLSTFETVGSYHISNLIELNSSGSLVSGNRYLISFLKSGGSGSSGSSGISGYGSSGTSGSGSPGSSGTSGNGSPGSSGTSGHSGSSGTSGSPGPSGSSGTSGTSGTSGVQGPAGPSGGGGSSGTSGAGTSGTSGTSGAGTSGTSGTSGAGTSGTSGTSGVGTSGTTGTSGTSGMGTSGSSGTSVSGSGVWCPIYVTAAYPSIIQTNQDVTSYVKIGLPIKYTADGFTNFYGIVTGVTYSGGNTFIGIDGPPCNTTAGGENAHVGQPYMLHTETFAINGAYADAANEILLYTDTKTYWKWFTNTAYLVRFNVIHVTNASTTNPKVNVVINNNSVSLSNSNSGITVGTSWSSSLTSVDTTYYRINFDEPLEIRTNTDVGTTHASDLTVQCTFVIVSVDCAYSPPA